MNSPWNKNFYETNKDLIFFETLSGGLESMKSEIKGS